MDTLDKNLFYNSILTTYKKKYDEATERRWLICIPKDDIIEPSMINDKFVDAHILKPSPLLKSHYIPTNERIHYDIEIDGNNLILTKGNYESNQERIAIIGEEIGYNMRNQQYKILLIDNCLINTNNKKISLGNYEKKTESNSTIMSFEECKNYLNNLADQSTTLIEAKTKKLMNTYVILPKYIQDAADRIKAVIDWGIELIRNISPNCENLEMIVESFVIGLIYPKLFPAIIKHNSHEDKILKEKFKLLMENRINPVQFGAQKVFSDLSANSKVLNELYNLDKSKTPMEKLRSFRKAMDLINEQINDIVKDTYSPILSGKSQSICVMSDDLIAIVICVLASAKLEHFASEINFIQTFSWYLPRNNEYGYSFVTFEVAKEFIKNFNIEDLYKYSKEKTRSCCETHSSEYSFSCDHSSFENDLDLSSKSSLDRELEKLAKMIEISKDESTINSEKKQMERLDSELGEFLGSLAQNSFTVDFGKQY